MDYLLIWDIDGTLIPQTNTGKRLKERAFFELYNVEEAFSKIDIRGRIDAETLFDAYNYYDLADKDPEEFFERYCEILSEEMKKVDSSMALPGILDLMEILESKDNFYNVLGTGNIRKAAEIKLSNDNLFRHFKAGGFGEEPTERWRVIEKAVTNACECFGKKFENERVYVIGDTPKDIESGKRLGVKTIGLATGEHTCKELEACGADYVFDNLADIDRFLGIFKD